MGKEYIIFAGVNGAGKSTFYNFVKNAPSKRINSDEILREKGGDWRNSLDQANAMKEAVQKMRSYLEKGISFNQETTLTGNSIINNIKKAKELGYTVKVYYIGLKNADLAVQRVAARVRKGGHGIPEEDIRRRYGQSLQNLKKIIPICDRVQIYDNSEKYDYVASYENGKQIFRQKVMLKMVLKFDEEKLRENGYSLEKIYQYLNKLVLDHNLTVCEDGVYTDSGDDYNDTFSFMVIAPVISHNEWMQCAKEWLWYEGSDVQDDLLKTFEINI